MTATLATAAAPQTVTSPLTAPGDQLTTLEEALSNDGFIRLFVGVERIPGLDKNADLLKQLDTDFTAPDQPEARLAPVGGDKLVVEGHVERWLPVRLDYGLYEFTVIVRKTA